MLARKERSGAMAKITSGHQLACCDTTTAIASPVATNPRPAYAIFFNPGWTVLAPARARAQRPGGSRRAAADAAEGGPIRRSRPTVALSWLPPALARWRGPDPRLLPPRTAMGPRDRTARTSSLGRVCGRP